MKELIGRLAKTERGFPIRVFPDAYGTPCKVQASSAIGDRPNDVKRPGTSFLWVGLIGARAMVKAADAAAVGLETAATTGWVDYPLPDKVYVPTSMHLGRAEVRQLVRTLQHWLQTGELDNQLTQAKQAKAKGRKKR